LVEVNRNNDEILSGALVFEFGVGGAPTAGCTIAFANRHVQVAGAAVVQLSGGPAALADQPEFGGVIKNARALRVVGDPRLDVRRGAGELVTAGADALQRLLQALGLADRAVDLAHLAVGAAGA